MEFCNRTAYPSPEDQLLFQVGEEVSLSVLYGAVFRTYRRSDECSAVLTAHYRSVEGTKLADGFRSAVLAHEVNRCRAAAVGAELVKHEIFLLEAATR